MSIGTKHGMGASQTPDDLLYLIRLLLSSGGSGSLPLTPTIVTGPTTFGPTLQQRLLLCDTTAGPVILNLPATTQNVVWIIKDAKGQSGVNPITLNAPATWTLETPNNPGNQAPSGTIASQGASVLYVQIFSSKSFVQVN
jgi:hypothetical protein